jgi:hypothetical protein
MKSEQVEGITDKAAKQLVAGRRIVEQEQRGKKRA